MSTTVVRQRERIHRLVLCVLYVFALCTPTVLSECDFPSYLPSGVVWTATYRNKGYLTLYFKQNMIDAMYCPTLDQTCIKYERSCIQEVEQGRYLVKHQPKGRDSGNIPAEYMCMQFIRRSDSIVQFKESSKLSYQNPDFCLEANLNLDHWPIISPTMTKSPPITCPIVGGFNMRIRGLDGDLCLGKLVLPRMESECENGDGIRFDFRYAECLHPNLNMRIQQTVKCVTTWTHGKYIFVILRPDSDEFEAWCLRITKSVSGEFEQIHLFMDPVCDPGTGNGHGQITETDNYLSITLQKITVPSVCANEFEGCNDPRFCDSEIVEYCHLSCNRCKPEVELCTFPENVRGSWLLDAHGGPFYMNISSYQLFVPKFGRFQCLARNVSRNESRTALLHVFDNGCFPRFVCLEMFQPSTSVRQFRLSNRVSWPHWPVDEAEKYTCMNNKFKTSRDMGNQEIPMQVLLETSVHYSTHCHLPDIMFKGKLLFFRVDKECNGCLIYDSSMMPDMFDIIAAGTCPREAGHTKYVCLASLDLDANTKGVITGSKPDRDRRLTNFFCWVFTMDGKKRKIIGLKASDCNMQTVEQVLEGLFKPEEEYGVIDYTQGATQGACPSIDSYSHVEQTFETHRNVPVTIHERSSTPPIIFNTPFVVGKTQSQQKEINSNSAPHRGSLEAMCMVIFLLAGTRV